MRGSAGQAPMSAGRGAAARFASARPGSVLLEAIVALTILVVAGGSAVIMTAQSAEAVGRVRVADAETRRASAFLDAVALWPRSDLDRHLGERVEGPWILGIERTFPELYAVTLDAAPDSARGQSRRRQLLQTTLFRPDANATR